MALLRSLAGTILASALAFACGSGPLPVTTIDGGQDGGSDGGDDGGGFSTGDAGPCPTDPPPDRIGDATVTPGVNNKFLLKGRVATPESLFEPGQVLVVNDQIVCVGTDCSTNASAPGATVIDTKGVIFPGLVDAHNHTQYNYLPLWVPSPPRLFQNRAQWAALPDYSAWTRSVNDNEAQFVCEQVKFGELRAMIGGVTTIQGSFNVARTCFNKTLVHNAEHGSEFVNSEIRTNIPGIDSVDANYATTLRSGMLAGSITAYVIHLAEGIDEKSRKELDTMITKGLLLPQTVLIHGTALGRADLQKVADAHAKIVWSPLSNLLLYGKTTDVKTALELGIDVSVAPDWTLSGSPSMLAELRVARDHSCSAWEGLLDAKKLVMMATSVPADSMALGKIGRLAPGNLADLLVIADRGQEAYRTLIEAKLGDVRLVMIAGNLRYGDSALIAATGRAPCDAVQMCGLEKRICVPDSTTSTDKLDQSFVTILQTVSGFYTNPLPLDQCQ